MLENKLPRKERSENRSCESRTQICIELYHQTTEDEFVEKINIKRATFAKVKILETIWHQIFLAPANSISHLTSPDR